MEFKKIIIKNKKVLYSECKEGYTLMLSERGGPIIFDKDFDKAIERFELALDVCMCVELIIMHSKMSEFGASDEEIATAWKYKIN
jgi:hypothetical protein